MASTVLDGWWHAHATNDELRRRFIEHDFDDRDWAKVQVPGHWSAHPEFEACTSVLYRHCFTLSRPKPAESARQWLVLDGIWAEADVWFDGHYLGPTNAWFSSHEFEISQYLRQRTDHVLAIEVMSPRRQPGHQTRTLQGLFGDPTIVGHDNLGGVWGPVRIETTGPVHVSKLRIICTRANEHKALLRLRAHFDSAEPRALEIATSVDPVDGPETEAITQRHHLASGETVLEWETEVSEPLLWWPWSLGSQPLYRAGIQLGLDTGKDETSSISESCERIVGLREVKMSKWQLSINGERLFCKGVDAWPTRAKMSEATGEMIAEDVARAKALGLDLIRVESHIARAELYAAADGHGMLLWQDLPLRGEAKRSVQSRSIEAAHRLVDSLGSHPSIVVWGAHYDPAGTSTGPRASALLPTRRAMFGVAKQQLPTWNKSVLDRLLARAFNRADGSRPVIASSGTWPSAPLFDGTDVHLKFGWSSGTGRDLALFARRIPRMVRWVSSMGSQSISQGEQVNVRNWPPDLGLLADRYGLNETSFRSYLDPAGYADSADWALASQAYQAILLRRQIETLRRLKYRPTGGFTFAALADSRPAISAAIYDFDRQPKAAVDAVKAACRPVIVVADRLPAEIGIGDPVLVDIHVVNDRRHPVTRLLLTAHLRWTGGEHRWAWRGNVEPDDVARVGSINWVAPNAVGPVSLHLVLTDDQDSISENRYHSSIA